jgi:hypothetical protein
MNMHHLLEVLFFYIAQLRKSFRDTNSVKSKDYNDYIYMIDIVDDKIQSTKCCELLKVVIRVHGSC